MGYEQTFTIKRQHAIIRLLLDCAAELKNLI
jgi:hypothetical protein